MFGLIKKIFIGLLISIINAWYKTLLGLIKKIFIGLSIRIINAPNHTNCVSLSNQKCMTQPTLISLHTNE